MTQWMRFIGPNFTMQVPSEWMVISSTQFQVMFLSPPMQDGRSINLVLVLQTSDTTPQDYINTMVKPQAQTRDNYQLLTDAPFTTQSGVTGYQYVFSATYEPNQVILQRHIIFKQANTLYWFLASLPTNIAHDLQAKINDILNTMLESFMFTEMNLEAILG
ncbi:MAG: hypothetical protein CUN52_13515 [Phototrophicales bacterium]|jgi:hypothetical protein|nr:MAG: hypothetical protein CUN52_13515 [Phototrophicales bacterium]